MVGGGVTFSTGYLEISLMRPYFLIGNPGNLLIIHHGKCTKKKRKKNYKIFRLLCLFLSEWQVYKTRVLLKIDKIVYLTHLQEHPVCKHLFKICNIPRRKYKIRAISTVAPD